MSRLNCSLQMYLNLQVTFPLQSGQQKTTSHGLWDKWRQSPPHGKLRTRVLAYGTPKRVMSHDRRVFMALQS